MMECQGTFSAEAALEKLTEHLEGKVAERTAALRAEIEDRKRAEEALQQARDELAMRLEARTAELAHANHALQTEIAERRRVEALLSTLSHELRTPLAILRGFAELLLEGHVTPEKQRECVTIIRLEAIRLTALILDFLDLQRAP